MENQKNQVAVQTKQEVAALLGKEYKPKLINAMEVGNKVEVAIILKQFKTNDGNINYPAVLSIPSNERIPELAKQDFRRVLLLIIGAITVAMESLAVKKRLNEIQILDCAENIIDTSGEDNLSFEDIMLFLQKLTRGEYKLPAELDTEKFMNVFEVYREQRHQEYHELQYNRHLQYKSLGDANRSAVADPLSEHFAKMGDRMSTLKSQISELKQENNSLKMDNL